MNDCGMCVYHTDNGCSQWECSFETLENHDKRIMTEVIDEFKLQSNGFKVHYENCPKADEPMREEIKRVLNGIIEFVEHRLM